MPYMNWSNLKEKSKKGKEKAKKEQIQGKCKVCIAKTFIWGHLNGHGVCNQDVTMRTLWSAFESAFGSDFGSAFTQNAFYNSLLR